MRLSKIIKPENTIKLEQVTSLEELHNFVKTQRHFSLSTQQEDYSGTELFYLFSALCELKKAKQPIHPLLSQLIQVTRLKIQIDGKPLHSYISYTVPFGVDEEYRELDLSKLLLSLKGKTNKIDILIKAFAPLDPHFLRQVLFRLKPMPHQSILEAIDRESRLFYTPYQTLFHLLYKRYYHPHLQLAKTAFDTYWAKEDKSKIPPYYIHFLTQAQELDLAHILKNYDFVDFSLKKCVDKNWALTQELLPPWLEKWVEEEPKQRLDFLAQLGFHNEDSQIVKFRKALISSHYNRKEVLSLYQTLDRKSEVVRNTLTWLSPYDSKVITANIGLIQRIHATSSFDQEEKRETLLPIIDYIDHKGYRSYRLASVPWGETLYFLPKKIKYPAKLFNTIRHKDAKQKWIDQTAEYNSSKFKKELIKLKTQIDTEKLKQNSKLWSPLFYKKWSEQKKYPVYIYSGSGIPYQQACKSIVFFTFEKGKFIQFDDCFYIVQSETDKVLSILEELMPSSAYRSLKEWHYLSLQKPTLCIQNFFNPTPKIETLLRKQLGLTDRHQEDHALFRHALYHLSSLGFDLSEVKKEGPFLTHIRARTDFEINCLILFAQNGTLLLSPNHWHLLSNPKSALLVVFPAQQPKFFSGQAELLKDPSFQGLQVYVPKPSSIQEMDHLLDTNSSTKQLLIQSNK